MKIAITGGTGFVGLHLANRLAAAGHEVVAIGRRARPSELGVSVAAPFADALPADLAPTTPFGDASIRAGLPDPGRFGRADLRWCRVARHA